MDSFIEAAKYIVTGLLMVLAVFLRTLHRKVEDSVSRPEFNEALKTMRSEHEADRRELRENQIKLFERLDLQQQLLTQVATKLAVIVEMGGFVNQSNNHRNGSQ